MASACPTCMGDRDGHSTAPHLRSYQHLTHRAAFLSLPSPSAYSRVPIAETQPSSPSLPSCVSGQAVLPHLDSYRGLVNAGERVKMGLDLKPLHDNLDDFYFGYMLKRAGVPLKRVRLTTHPPRMDRKKSHSSSL